MLILGIDPGTQILGYSLLDTTETIPELVLMDVLYLRKIADFHLRIHKIFETTQRIIDSTTQIIWLLRLHLPARMCNPCLNWARLKELP